MHKDAMTQRPPRVNKTAENLKMHLYTHKGAMIQRQPRVNKTAESLKMPLYTHKDAMIQRPPTYVYVCIEVALCGDAHWIGRSNWAKGREPSGAWVQYPNPTVPSIPRHSRWVILMHVSALSEPTLLL